MKIYFVEGIDALDETFVEKCLSFFPYWRKEKILKYKLLNGKIKSTLAYLLLIHALREEGVFREMPEFYYGKHNKPYLKNYEGLYFNFSHSKNAVCCILAQREVGVDIQETGVYKESLANYVCNEKELAILCDSSNRAEDFFKLWTKKEAVFKMLGTGITNDIKYILDKPGYVVESRKVNDTWLSFAYRP